MIVANPRLAAESADRREFEGDDKLTRRSSVLKFGRQQFFESGHGTMPECRPIELAAYDSNWPRVFGVLRSQLQDCLGDLAVAIEHIGSTSVPGLIAKPVIDIDVAVDASDTHVTRAIRRLKVLGYIHEGDLGISGREALRAVAGSPSHHLYVCRCDNREYLRHLAFRDILRNNPLIAKAYAALKHSAAETFRDDRVAYSHAKTAFIEDLLETSKTR